MRIASMLKDETGIKGLLLNVEIDESDKSVEAHNGGMKGF